MNGQQLKEILARHGYTGAYLATVMKKKPETVYKWFALNLVNKKLIEKIHQATGIEEFNQLQEPAAVYGIQHHGKAVSTAIEDKGFSIVRFSHEMNETRPTTYKHFREKNWDEGRLLKAAQILNVPVAQLKGKGTGQKSFEKDIYEILQRLETALAAQSKMLQQIAAKQF